MEPSKGTLSPELEELIRAAKAYVESLTPEQKQAMLLEQAKSWAKAEAQWAMDFKEGKCERD